MSVSVDPKARERKPGVSSPVIVLSLLGLMLWMGWLYYHYFVPPPHASGPLPASKDDWISKMAVKAGGDFNKIDPKMQKALNMFSGGHGAEMIKSKYDFATH